MKRHVLNQTRAKLFPPWINFILQLAGIVLNLDVFTGLPQSIKIKCIIITGYMTGHLIALLRAVRRHVLFTLRYWVVVFSRDS